MKRIIAVILIAVSLLSVFAGCSKKSDDADSATADEIVSTQTPDEAIVEEMTTVPATTVPETTAPKETQAGKLEVNYVKDTTPLPNYNSVCSVYKSLVYRLAKEAVAFAENLGETDTYNSDNAIIKFYGNSGMIPNPEEILNNVGYYYKDINRDGVPELIIESGSIVYGLYTYYKGQPVLLYYSWIRCPFYILSDGRVYVSGSNGMSHIYYVKYLPERGGKLLTEVKYYREWISNDLFEIRKNDVVMERTTDTSRFNSIIKGYENKIISGDSTKLSKVYTYTKPTEPTVPTEPEVTGAVVHGAYGSKAEEMGIEFSRDEAYIGDEDTYAGYFVFWTDDDISEFRFQRRVDGEFVTIHTISDFSNSDPVVFKFSINSHDVYGIEYVDAQGNWYKQTIHHRSTDGILVFV